MRIPAIPLWNYTTQAWVGAWTKRCPVCSYYCSNEFGEVKRSEGRSVPSLWRPSARCRVSYCHWYKITTTSWGKPGKNDSYDRELDDSPAVYSYCLPSTAVCSVDTQLNITAQATWQFIDRARHIIDIQYIHIDLLVFGLMHTAYY